jgi:DNA-binding NarL/FixJ family response regulator
MIPLPISVAIIDSHVLFRKILSHFLSLQDNISVVFQVSSTHEGLDLLKAASIDIILINPNVALEPMLLRSMTIDIRNEFPGIKIIGLWMFDETPINDGLMTLSFDGIICKSDEPDTLLRIIRGVYNHQIYNDINISRLGGLGQKNVHGKNYHQGLNVLNDREKKIIELIWEGKSNKEIADTFFLGSKSIEKMRQDMKEKLGVKSTIGLIKYGIAKGIIRTKGRTPNSFEKRPIVEALRY